MKKIAVIGDVHGRTNWKQIDFSHYDEVIFMGDYFDPYAYNISSEEVYNNFREILELKKSDPKKFVLLFGNHDLHYLVAERGGRERYSRFDYNLVVQYHVGDRLQKALEDGLIEAAYCEPNTDLFFIHATLSMRWYNFHVLGKPFSVSEEEGVSSVGPSESDRLTVVAKINNLLLDKPEAFYFDGPGWDVYGYTNTQGPLWWRCMNEWGSGLQEEYILRGIYQICGHTQVPDLDLNVCESGAKVAFVDLLGSDRYTEITINDNNEYFFEEKKITFE